MKINEHTNMVIGYKHEHEHEHENELAHERTMNSSNGKKPKKF